MDPVYNGPLQKEYAELVSKIESVAAHFGHENCSWIWTDWDYRKERMPCCRAYHCADCNGEARIATWSDLEVKLVGNMKIPCPKRVLHKVVGLRVKLKEPLPDTVLADQISVITGLPFVDGIEFEYRSE